jgi:hypothetical protein
MIENSYGDSMVGSVWVLKVDCLGNKAGTIGYCFNDYMDFDIPGKSGVQIIFRNGEYDGFSVKEQNDFLEFVCFDLNYTNYKFTNVITVSRDFDGGYWKWSK